MATPIKLRIRNLQTNETGVAAFDGEAEAAVWLKARPPFVDVMGMAGQTSVPTEVQERLKAIMRPLGEDEKLAERELALENEKADIEREKVAQIQQKKDEEREAQELAGADPHRIMEVRWRFDSEMALTDPKDSRAISDDARAAVHAWIAERNEWVAGRGQQVGECTVKVWPGTLPAKESERVKEGRFVPVSADEKK